MTLPAVLVSRLQEMCYRVLDSRENQERWSFVLFELL